MAVIVERPPADKKGPAITSSILTTEAAQIEAGRNAIEITSVDKDRLSAGLLQNVYLPTGELYEVFDRGNSVVGLAVDFSLNCSTSEESLNISAQTILEVPDEGNING